MKSTPTHNRVKIFDTTLRDGDQAPGSHLTPAQKVEMAWQLHKLSVDVIEAGFPVSSPADFKAVEAIAKSVGREKHAPEIAALCRSVNADIEVAWRALQHANNPRIHTFLASSDLHLTHKLHMTRAEAIRRAVEGVRLAKSFTPNVQFSAEDSSRADLEFLAEMVAGVIDAGATTVNIPDTVGYALPSEFADRIRFLFNRVPRLRDVTVAVHCHDDLGMAVANTLAAVQVGARQVEGTINGIGERAGNCSLEEVIMAIHVRKDFLGVETGIRHEEIVPTSRALVRLTGIPVAPNKAIVGENAFSHASGIHQDGVLKNAQTYEIMRPEEVGAGETKLPLTARSGRRALETRLKKLGFRMDASALARIFQSFKILADQKSIIDDDDLVRMMG